MLKRKFTILMGIILSVFAFSQDKTENWYAFSTSVTGDFINNLRGGFNQGYTYIGMENLTLDLNLESLGWLKGTRLFFHGLNAHGLTPSTNFVGDMQVASNIESGNYTGFYEYYITQQWGNFNILLGQHDLNSTFIFTEYGGTFINSSFGIAPTISLNVPVSIYPTAAPAFVLSYSNKKNHTFEIGIYDGDPGDIENNRYNLHPNVNVNDGALLISEYQINFLVNNLNESYKIGAYYHTGNFTDYRDTLHVITGNYGIYSVLDLVLWSGFNHPNRYLGMFVQSSWAPGNINQIEYYIGAGIHYNGLLQDTDALGLAFAHAKISSDYKSLYQGVLPFETAVEFTYKINLFDHYFIQPNLQYIVNPGANSELENALVATLRFNITLEN